MTFDEDGSADDIRKLVLDRKVLSRIPQEKRLVFRLTESTSTYLFHQSVVDEILALNPRGLRFFPTSKWSGDVQFS